MPLSTTEIKQALSTIASTAARGVSTAMGGAPPPGGPQGVFDVSNDGLTWRPTVRVRAGSGTSFSVVDGEATVTAAALGEAEYATRAIFRASPPPADGAIFRIVSPPGEYRYSVSSGAGWADDDDTILKPDSILVGYNGRAFSTRASEHAATFAAARAMKGILGRAKHVHIESHTTFGDGGGGVFDVKDNSGGAYTDDDGNYIEAGDVALIRRDLQTATRSGWAGGITQAAIDLTPSGGVLILPHGTHEASGLVLNKPIKIIGENTTLKLPDATLTPIFTLASNNVTLEGITFDGNRWNQTGTVSDNPTFARQHSAVNSGTSKYSNIRFHRCEFENFFNSAIAIIADDIVIDDCNFRDINYHPLFLGYNEGDRSVYCDKVRLKDCDFERIGYKTSSGDAREFGNDLPSGTADAALIRGANVTVENCGFYDVDRLSLKFEVLRWNYTISNCRHINSYAGNSAFGTIGFGLPPGYYQVGDWVPTDSDPTNIVIVNDIANRPTATIGLAWANGVSITNAQYFSPSGTLDAGLLIANSRHVRVSQSSFRTSASLRTVDIYNIAVGSGETPPASFDICFSDTTFASTATPPGTIYLQADLSTLHFNNCKIDPTYGAAITHNAIYGVAYVMSDVRFTNCELGRHTWAVDAGKARTNFVWDGCTFEESLQAQALTSFSMRRTRVRNSDAVASVGVTTKSGGLNYFDDPEWSTFADGDATPSVKARVKFKAAYTAPTNITGFDDGVAAQEFLILFETGNHTLVNSATLKLSGSTNWTPTAGSSIRIVKNHDVYSGFISWNETSRCAI